MEHTIENIIKVLEAKEKKFRAAAEEASDKGVKDSYLWNCAKANATHEAINILTDETTFVHMSIIYGVEEDEK